MNAGCRVVSVVVIELIADRTCLDSIHTIKIGVVILRITVEREVIEMICVRVGAIVVERPTRS
ncbi:hypothetical protein J5500_03690 [Candidatus Saccharibacteria bacterium]|nr:hypothetical protein [Candidatus Saccharibacteria bacterium]